MTPLDFTAGLAPLIPPPRLHRHRYHGVLAPNAALRVRVTSLTTGSERDTRQQTPPADHAPATLPEIAARSRWARLLARIYEAFPLRCPDCGADMRIVAFLIDPFTVSGILGHLRPPHSAPPLSPARAPPTEAPVCDADLILDLDQTPTFDPTDPDPIPDSDLDQTHGA